MEKPARKLFITGSSGFVGTSTRRFLLENPEYRQAYEIIEPVGRVDLRDKAALTQTLAEWVPDAVIHLAGQSFVPRSFENPLETYEVNFLGTLNLLQALKASGFSGRMLYVGSGDQYGLVSAGDLPLVETQPLKPRNPYAVSKAAAELLCYQWSQTEGLDIVMARPFNHIGPGQDARFAVSDFARQVVEIRLGRRAAEISVGDIDVTRDFTDVRDVIRAYLMLLLEGKSGEVYNVCSGKEVSIREILAQLLALAGVQASIRQDSARFRPAEQRRVYGSCDKLLDVSGWRPAIPLEQSLVDNLNYWEWKLKHD